MPDTADIGSIAARATSLLAELPPRFAVAGHSLGGYIALELLTQAPERIDRLALISTNSVTDTELHRNNRLTMLEQSENGEFESVLETLADSAIHTAGPCAAEAKETFFSMARDQGPERFFTQQQAVMHRRDTTDALKTCNCPVLIAVGSNDRITPPQQSVTMTGVCPGAELATLPSTGHLLPLEAPGVLAEMLLSWIGEEAR